MFSTINETKTPSELVEWLRLWANGYEDGDALDDNDARQIADAVERVCAPCNAAALREALVKIEKLNHYDLSCVRSEKSRRAMDAKILDIELTIRAAIAAPARNADRFKTLDEAREAFQDLRGHKILADVELWDSMDEAGALVRWLFAPAQEGKEARRG